MSSIDGLDWGVARCWWQCRGRIQWRPFVVVLIKWSKINKTHCGVGRNLYVGDQWYLWWTINASPLWYSRGDCDQQYLWMTVNVWGDVCPPASSPHPPNSLNPPTHRQTTRSVEPMLGMAAAAAAAAVLITALCLLVAGSPSLSPVGGSSHHRAAVSSVADSLISGHEADLVNYAWHTSIYKPGDLGWQALSPAGRLGRPLHPNIHVGVALEPCCSGQQKAGFSNISQGNTPMKQVTKRKQIRGVAVHIYCFLILL